MKHGRHHVKRLISSGTRITNQLLDYIEVRWPGLIWRCRLNRRVEKKDPKANYPAWCLIPFCFRLFVLILEATGVHRFCYLCLILLRISLWNGVSAHDRDQLADCA